MRSVEWYERQGVAKRNRGFTETNNVILTSNFLIRRICASGTDRKKA